MFDNNINISDGYAKNSYRIGRNYLNNIIL